VVYEDENYFHYCLSPLSIFEFQGNEYSNQEVFTSEAVNDYLRRYISEK